MAVNRILTSDEKNTLQANPKFINEVNWAVRNFASYYTDNTSISTQIGAVGYEAWYKNRTFSRNVMTSGFQDSGAPLTFTVLAKGMNLWDNQVPTFDADTVVAYMVANGKFDELVVPYVALKTQSIIF